MANTVVTKISTSVFEEYTPKDLKLIPSFDTISQFKPNDDIVEFSIYNEQNLLEYISYNYKDYSIIHDYNAGESIVSTINIDPEKDVLKAGFEYGNYTAVYNFLRNELSSSQSSSFFIQEISSDRTELRLATNNLTNQEIESVVASFITELNDSPYFEDFHLNFGNNNIFIANNIALDNSNENQYTVLVKLYEPLDIQFELKDTLWIVLQTAEAVSFNIRFAPKVVESEPSPKLRGPNFEIQLKDVVNNSTPYENLTSLTTTTLTSSYNELQNLLAQKGVTVNINYSDFNDFVYFSSAQNRVENFYYKVKLIEEYQNEINELNSLNLSDNSSNIILLEKQIENIIKNFDGYEYYQYYSSGSPDIYPKINSTPPYILASTGSIFSLLWLNTQITSGSEYDIENPDRIVNNLPSFVKDDNTNAPFFLFMDMVGQHFDNMWVYTKDITNRFDADNRLNYGISKDIVSDAIRSMGVNLYQNNFSSDDLYSALLGINGSGSLLPPTGSEVIITYVTASSEVTKLDDVNKEIYKRIYHNLPYLLKKKGTVEGLRALINTYGIPDTILRISEFGGKDKDNTNDWDYFQNKFNYALFCSGVVSNTLPNSNDVAVSWIINPLWNSSPYNRPKTLSFRFKPYSLPTSNQYHILALLDSDTVSPTHAGFITLTYTGSGNSSSPYSGSIPSSSNQYATLTYWGSGSTSGTSSITSLTAPFYDGNWWSFTISSGSTYTLRTANKIYNGNDGFKIGYTTFNSNTSSNLAWDESTVLNLPQKNNPPYTPNPIRLGGNIYIPFTGSYQELRYYNIELGENEFYDLTLNPYSIEGSTYSSSAENLVFRAPLGSDLNISVGNLTSTHPKVTGSNPTQSFTGNSSYGISNILSGFKFIPNTEFIYYDQPAVGIRNRISQKIRIEDNILPSGDVLTPYRTIQQRYPQSESYTRDVNYVEVAFSPQNEINDDINSSMGYFNIGEYIGDPRQVSESSYSYPDLDRLRNSYFDKYYKNYNWNDYIRLIKYFDNSLFKMIKDFTPAKSGLSTGVVIKQHLLERNKQRPAQVEISQHDYSGSVYSQQMWDPVTEDTYISHSRISKINGGAGGVFNYINVYSSSILNTVSPQITQSWTYGVSGPAGGFILTQSSQDEFYNGELSGSKILATNGNLNLDNPYLEPSTTEHTYNIVKVFGDGSDNRGQESSLFQSQGGQGYTMFTFDINTLLAISSSQSDLKDIILGNYFTLAKRQGNIFVGTYTLSEVTDIFVSNETYNSPFYTGIPTSSIFNRATPLIKIKSHVPPYNEVIFAFTSSSLNGTGGESFNIQFQSCSIVGSSNSLPNDGSNVEIYFDSFIPNNTLLLRDFIDRSISSSGSLYLFYDSGSNL
jgi:hypothetical protein